VSLLPHSISRDVSERLGRAVARTGLTPNALTIIGLLGMGGAATLAAYGMFWQAGIAMLVAASFDMLDGAVARATDQASDWGAVFDAVSDRLADFALLFGLLIWYSAAERFYDLAMIVNDEIGHDVGEQVQTRAILENRFAHDPGQQRPQIMLVGDLPTRSVS